jgi:hypothetical protein
MSPILEGQMSSLFRCHVERRSIENPETSVRSDYDIDVLSLGAGVQSTALLLLADSGQLGEKPDVAIFSDVGWEPEAVYEQLEWIISKVSIEVHVVSAGNLRDDVLKVVGPAGQKIGRVANPPFFVRNDASDETGDRDDGGKLWRGCTKKYKIEPIQKKVRELLGYKKGQRVKKRCRQWFGISIDEASRMKDSRVHWIDNYYPLVDRNINRLDCQKICTEYGYPNLRKSACIGCPFHSNAFWAKMKRNYPGEFADACDFDHSLREGKLPGVTGDAFVHRRMMPLEEAVDSTHSPDQTDLFDFDEECEGMCGL